MTYTTNLRDSMLKRGNVTIVNYALEHSYQKSYQKKNHMVVIHYKLFDIYIFHIK